VTRSDRCGAAHGPTCREILCAGAVALLACGCPGAAVKRTYPPPSAARLVRHVSDVTARARSLRAETRSDVRIGKERANVTVLIMARWGGKLRFMAMNPNDTEAADLAADGARYAFIDYKNNCGDAGPATPENVARLIRIVMQPDDVVRLLFGSTPVLGGAAGTVAWDEDGGHEVLALAAGGFTQRIVLDGRERRWDVLESEVKGPDGKRVWRVRHKDFHPVKRPDGSTLRLPGKSYFEQQGDTLLIRWREQELDLELGDEKFQMELPPGLPICGG